MLSAVNRVFYRIPDFEGLQSYIFHSTADMYIAPKIRTLRWWGHKALALLGQTALIFGRKSRVASQFITRLNRTSRRSR